MHAMHIIIVVWHSCNCRRRVSVVIETGLAIFEGLEILWLIL